MLRLDKYTTVSKEWWYGLSKKEKSNFLKKLPHLANLDKITQDNKINAIINEFGNTRKASSKGKSNNAATDTAES